MSGNLRNFRRVPEHGVIAGVLAGIAEYFDWNVRLLRAVTVVVFIFSGFFPIVVAYGVLWYVMDPVSPGAASRPFAEPAGAAAYTSSSSTPSSTRPATMTDLKARFGRLEERLGYMEDCVTTKEFELRRELKKLEA